jgi:hypothetical protein
MDKLITCAYATDTKPPRSLWNLREEFPNREVMNFFKKFLEFFNWTLWIEKSEARDKIVCTEFGRVSLPPTFAVSLLLPL